MSLRINDFDEYTQSCSTSSMVTVKDPALFGSNTSDNIDNNSSPYALMGCSFSKDDDKLSNFNATKNTDLHPTKFYDDKGNLIKQNFGPYTIEYEYDENGNKTKEIKRDMHDVEGDDIILITYFDETGKAVRRTWQTGIGAGKSKEYSGEVVERYDNKTGLKIRTTKDNKGQVISIEYINNNGQIVKDVAPHGIVLDKNNKLINTKRTCNYEYNEQGLLIKETSLPNNNITTYKYNEKNQLIKMQEKWSPTLNGTHQTYITNYVYNSNNQLIEVNQYSNNKFECGLKISYDKNGQEAERRYVFDDGSPYRIIKYKDGKILSDKEVNL